MSAASSLAVRYARFTLGRSLILLAFALALVLSVLADIATGPSPFPLAKVLAGLLEPDTLSRGDRVILWDIRMPAAAMAVVVGAALGLAGAEMQTVLNNPLASPFTLGVSNAATLGAALVIALDLTIVGLEPTLVIPLAAFAFAMGSTLIVQGLAKFQGATADTVVLFGIAMVFVLNALLWLVQYMASADALQQIVFWTMGSLGRSTWDKVAVVAVVFLACLPLSMRHVWVMTALRGGEDHARSFGVPVERLRLLVLLRVSLLAGAAVAFVGTISFIGLVGPHIARLALGEDHRFTLPGAAIAGALVLSLASIASKMLVPGVVLPVGIVTALVGIPLFMGLLLMQRRPS
jgi:ABC-type Fe3+-siderophore transport system, permease component